MRIFKINTDGKFEEFSKIHFPIQYEESILENWIENNSDDILEDGKLLIIGRQVTTNLGSIIDLLGIDHDGNSVVIELKRDRTPRDTLAQALEYASFVEGLNTNELEEILQNYLSDDSINLAEYHKNYFELSQDEAISFNKEQRIVLVGQKITGEIRQTASFLRKKGLRVTCLEFSYFQATGGQHLLSYDIVVGKEPTKSKRISTGSLPVVNKTFFIESLDENGKEVFTKLFEFASQRNLPIHWGTKGFSLNVNKNGTHVAICYGYPPSSVFKQSIYTALVGQGGLLNKLNVPEAEIEELWTEIQKTELFIPAGREFKMLIERKFNTEEIQTLLRWLKSIIKVIEGHELK